MSIQNTTDRTIYSVTQLNKEAASTLEQTFSWVWVEGEISNLSKPASGHMYFSLKDKGAQIRCAMFRSRSQGLSFNLENGQQILLRGKVSLYQPRGDYQLIVDRVEMAGDGLLRRQYDALLQKLSTEGLFDESHKQAIPELPGCIGVITSNSGAAIHDVLSVINRRFPAIPVKLYSVPVQGAESAPAICRALELAEEHAECDVVLLVRGGGSLEDLWSFNDEKVAHAIFDCPVPVVSGVGHEVDVTIADFVADYRAATPSAAAESVTPDQEAWLQSLQWYRQRLHQLVQEKTQRQQERLNWLSKRLSQQHPVAVMQALAQKIDDLEQRMQFAWRYRMQASLNSLNQLRSRLLSQSPQHTATYCRNRLQLLWQRFNHQMQFRLGQHKAQLANNARTLQAISPLQTLERGYSITSNQQGEAIIRSSAVAVGDEIRTRLHDGQLTSRIEKIKSGD